MKEITLTTINRFEAMTKLKEEIPKHTKEECIACGLIFFKELLKHTRIDQETTDILHKLEMFSTLPISIVEARKMAFILHAKARNSDNVIDEFVYRAFGHLMATIHVITHNYAFLTYFLKAYHQLGLPIDALQEMANMYDRLLNDKKNV